MTHAFDLWRRGIEPSPAIESDLADLARGTDSYLLQTGAATEARAERAFEEGLAMVVGATLLVMALSAMSVRRLKRTADGLRIAELREQSDRRVRALIEHAPDVVVLVDRANGKISYASPSMTRVLGYGPDDLASWNWHRSSIPRINEASTGRSAGLSCRAVTVSGRRRGSGIATALGGTSRCRSATRKGTPTSTASWSTGATSRSGSNWSDRSRTRRAMIR